MELILRTVDDPLLDPDEIVNIRIVPSGYYTPGDAAAVALTIADNETGVSIRADDDSAAEPGDAAAFLLTRSGPAAGELTVTLQSSGSAVAGIDYLPLADSVTFASGQTALTLTLTPVDDNAAEPGETLTVTLVPGSGYLAGESSATITIHDDDANAAPVISLVSPVEGTVFLPSGPGLLLDAEISDDGRPWPASPLTVEWSKVSGPGSVTFGDSAAAGTSAAFGAPGPYVMELRVSDAELSSTLRVNVFVIGDSLTGMNIGTASSLTGRC